MEKCLDCPVEKTFRDGRSHWSEETGYVKDGTQAHWLVTTAPMRNAAGEVDSVMEMCLDITTRKRLEEDLRRSEKKYWAIFNNIPNPVFVLDPSNLRILDCNDRVSPVYGWHKEELTGTSFLDLFSPNDRQNAFQLIRSSQIINQMKQVTRKGTVIFVSIRISPSEYGDKQVLLVTTSDITKRLETEQQLIQSNKMTTLGEMASGIAHELNQPLAVIKTASNYLRKKKAKGEAVRDEIMTTMLEEIDANVDRSTKIINHLRDFSRKPNMELVPVQLGEVMAKAMDIFSQQLKLREIEVKWDLEEGLPDIKGEQGQLEQVFINLLINARDAIEDRWGYKDGGWGRKEILLRTQRVDGSVQAQVKDTGCGIPKALLDRIFEPFFTTKEVSKGTGLGLSITYRIVQDCGGRIDVDSIEGQGTTFTLTFPAAEER
jgi:histidine kinase